MNRDEIKNLVLNEFVKIAPEFEIDDLELDVNIQEEFDIDSMDLLMLIVAINEKTGVEVPEADYGKWDTFNNMIDYIEAALT